MDFPNSYNMNTSIHTSVRSLIRTLLLLLCMASSCTLQAQTWSEFFKQKKTQIKYLTQQIAALQVYIGYVEKGYDITRDGLDFIGDLKDGEFSLHKDYFSSLDQISGAVRKDTKITTIEDMERSIFEMNDKALKMVDTSSQLSPDEKGYVRKVWSGLLSDSQDKLNELALLTTSGNYQLTDAERLERIAGIHQDMQSTYSFACSFYNKMTVYAAEKKKETGELQRLSGWYDLKNEKR